MARSAFETLNVFKLSERLADCVWNYASQWSPLARDTLGKQLIRAADSIGANIAEGHGRGDARDHKRFIRIAWGSANEVKYWLRRAYCRNLLTKEQVNTLKPILISLPKMLNAYLKAIRD